MQLPEPEPGLVICYSYLWRDEAAGGQIECLKDRPCVIIASVEHRSDGTTLVTVLPITHQSPKDLAEAVELPPGTKKRLRLDWERSWVKVNEANRFVWPGYDLRKIPRGDAYDYGFVGPKLFDKIMRTAAAWHERHRMTITPRE